MKLTKASVFTILSSVSIILLAVALSTAAFAAVASSPYVDSKNQFSINPPSGWTIDSTGSYGTAVILYGPTDSNFRINMNVIVGATSLSLSDYVAASKTQLATGLNNYRLVSETPTTIGGVAADELVNTFTQGSYNIWDQQDIMVQNGKAYIITSSALQTNYSTYQPSFTQSVQTFQITAPAFPLLIVAIGIIIIVAVIVVVVVVVWRRMSRATAPPMPPPMYQPPPPPSNPPPQP